MLFITKTIIWFPLCAWPILTAEGTVVRSRQVPYHRGGIDNKYVDKQISKETGGETPWSCDGNGDGRLQAEGCLLLL